jgi:hypothetical protein
MEIEIEERWSRILAVGLRHRIEALISHDAFIN